MNTLLVHCLKDDVEIISEFLEETGALSTTFTDQYDDPILEPEIGTTPLWENVIVEALYQDEAGANKALASLSAAHPTLKATIQELPEQDWERAWMDNYSALQFGKNLWVCPSWLTPPEPQACNLMLDPGLAFGTGTHPTTSLCLTWLDGALLTNKTMIDYGCGSGILALAAIKLGVQHVFAVDLDEQALSATQNNAQLNAISGNELSVALPDALQVRADLIVANILLSPLLALKDRFHQLLKDEGMLTVSGVLKEQVSELIDAYQDCFTHQESQTLDDWALVVFQKK